MVVQELIAKLGFQVDKAALDKADKGLASLAKNAALMYAAYAGASKAFGLVVDSVKGAALLEAMNAEFEVMLGNAEAAKYLVQQIQQFAAVTPYTTQELTSQVRLMMAFGQSANESLSAVKMLGDVAGSDSEKLGRLSLAYAQVMAAGKMQGQDLLQFVNAGFNPLQELSAKTGKSIATLRAEMEKGLISSAMVAEAFQRATGPGGRFFGNMDKQSQTLFGLWSTLSDVFQITMAQLGGQLVPFIKDVLVVLIDLGDEIAGAYRQLGDFFGILLGDGLVAGDVAAYIAAGFQTIADAIMLIVSVATGLWAVLQGLFGMLMSLVTGILVVFTAPFALLLKAVSFLEQKIANILRAVGLVSASKAFQAQAFSADAGAEGFMFPARFTGAMAGDSFSAAGRTWDKANALFGMVGQTKAQDPGARQALTDEILKRLEGKGKAQDPGARQALTDEILKRLEGKGKVVTVTTNVNNTIHAEGTMKDILQEQANSVFGLTFQQRLIAAAV